MRSTSLPFILAGSFLLFIGGLIVFFRVDDGLNHGPYRMGSSTQNSKQTLNLRALEDSKITAKLEKVENEPSALFNDPAIAQAWGLKKADAARAWSVTKGSRQIIVAVIDTGVDINHEDLKNNYWKNPGETGKDSKGRNKETNGIDDDKNGFVDDVHGWNFVSGNHNLSDNHGHGTHITGIIAAEANNNKGIVGIAPEVSIMTLKYFDPLSPGADNLKNTIKAINYAVKMGAHIINYSGGGLEYSQDEFEAVASARKKGILFVAAAGNEKSNSDKIPYYPADYNLDNIISVTAFNPAVEVLASSNWGTESVHIAAPGQNVISTLPGNAYGFMTGTSQATAFVTGGAALIMSHKVGFKYSDVRKYILSTGDALASLADKTKTSRKLNLYKALTVLDQDLTASGVRASNSGNIRVLSEVQAESTSSLNSTAQFGKSLIEALQKAEEESLPAVKGKKERLGSKPEL
ncbi:MAG: S8 family peptidase [Bdellovibrionales bacterium]